MLYIFDSTEKLITTLPKGSFFDAVHYEVLNGENTFEFTVPAGSEYVVEGNLVAFRDLDSYWQVFEVKRIVDVHGDGLTRTAYCEHIFYELLDDIVIDKRPSADATAALAGMLDGTRWQVGIVDDLGASSTSAYYESALSAVQKVANAWHGELNWRCVIQGGAITRYVDLLAQRGTDTGKQFAYSKDILNIEREVDSSGVVTALYGRGKGIELDSGSYGRRLTFADVVAPDKPADQEWIGDSDALAQWGRPGNRHRFGVFVDEEETDPAKLLQKTRDELDRRKTPRATYRLDVVSLEELTGYEHEKVRLGDTVRVIDREFSPELVVSARVIEIERDILDPANTKVVLGSFAPTIVEATINTARRVNEMANKPYNTKWLDGKISVLQNEIENVQSYVFQTAEDGILVLDAPTYDQATKAMKLGGGMFAIANQKDGNGGWNWRTFGDGSGFTADLITAGMIDAGLIQIGPQTTFAPGYDPSQIEGASAVGMGVDADCLGLWHFDGSLNSHKGVAADSDALFGGGCFGQALNIATGKHLKVPTTDMLAGEGVINFRAKNLSASANGSMLIDLPDNAGNQGMLCGIADDGKLFIEDAKLQFQAVETSQADFNTGTLSDVQATSTGNLELVRDGTDFSYAETSQSDFNSGTLTDVTATSDGDLELDEISPTWDLEYTASALPQSATPAWTKSDYGSGYTEEITSGQLHLANSSSNNIYYSRNGVVTTGNTISVKARVKVTSSTSDAVGLFIDDGSKRVYAWLYTNKITVVDGSNHDYTVDMTSYREVELRKIAQTGWKLFVDGIERLSGTAQASGNTNWIMFGHAMYPNYGESYWDWLNYSLDFNEEYESSGTRIKEVDISGSNPAGGTKIEWSKTTPTGTTVTVETALSLDGGSTYGTWQEATSGSSIPSITAQTDLSNARLKIRQTLTTSDTSNTPQLHSLNLSIYAPYKSNGYRYKVYDISAVSSVGSSKITWTENNPASTTLTVKAALSTDGGSTYGSWQTCTNGQAIPGLTQGMDVSNARLKVQEDLATSDGTKTPQLQSLTIEVGGDTQKVYGSNKSTLTAWDSISLAYKSDRLSLVVNDTEACYIENPSLPTALGSYLFIGTDRSGVNAINTLVDELRIDKVYREVATRTAWHKTGVPFYTSEDMKQWPGYLRAETDGLKVYDSSNSLRVLIGSWLRDAVRKYGIKIIEGEMYSGIIRTGGESDTTYIQLISPNLLQVFANGKKQMEIDTEVGGRIQFFNDGVYTGDVRGEGNGNIFIYSANKIWLLGQTGVDVQYGINVTGGTKNCIEDTIYGKLAISARESPEVRYIDEGMGTLTNGECRVDVDPIFMECIEPHTPDSRWYVNLTPYGKAILYVDEIGDGYFVVKDYNGNANGIEFTWSLSATRKDYALIRFMEVLD